MMRGAIVTLVLVLAGCASARQVVRVPEVVEVPHYVEIDAALTAPCKVEEPRSAKVREALRVARERRRVLEDCDARMSRIRAIEGTRKP